jgi:hypothetical protein
MANSSPRELRTSESEIQTVPTAHIQLSLVQGTSDAVVSEEATFDTDGSHDIQQK